MKYLLTCPQCGSKLTVEAGQAGQQLRCDCGREIEVPSVRHLRELEPVAEAASAPAAWSVRQGLMFLGLAIIVVAVAVGGAIAVLRPSTSDESLALKIDKEAIEHEVNALTPSIAYSKLESVVFVIPGYSEQLAHGEIPPLLAPCLELLTTFEGKGPMPLAPKATQQLEKEASKRVAELRERFATRRTMDDWLWLVGLAVLAGVVLICVSAILPRRRRVRAATAGAGRR